MITAERLATLTTFTPKALAVALANSGYKGCEFDTAEFLGITNGGQFCYRVTFFNDELDCEDTGKVFLSYNRDLGSVSADF